MGACWSKRDGSYAPTSDERDERWKIASASASEALDRGLLKGDGSSSSKEGESRSPDTVEQDKDSDDGMHRGMPAAKPPKLSRLRRRLTVEGSDPNADGSRRELRGEGMQKQRSADGNSGACAPTSADGHINGTLITAIDGKSVKGYAPYNPKKENQDIMIIHHCAPGTPAAATLLAVFDGHGEDGHLVSRHFRERLPDMVSQHPQFASDPARAITEAVLEAEAVVIGWGNVDTSLSGSTAVIASLRGSHLTACNIGDSRLVIGFRGNEGAGEGTGGGVCAGGGGAATGKGSASPSPFGGVTAREITHDHKPESPAERARIEAKGGRVEAITYEDGYVGPHRVWLADQNIPGLAMSRSVCDTVAKEAGVTSDPEVFEEDLDANALTCIVLASDGLWEFVENQEAIDVVTKIQQAGKPPSSAVQELQKMARALWLKNEGVADDTTIIVCYCGGSGT